jgi:hypothetical protein
MNEAVREAIEGKKRAVDAQMAIKHRQRGALIAELQVIDVELHKLEDECEQYDAFIASLEPDPEPTPEEPEPEAPVE